MNIFVLDNYVSWKGKPNFRELVVSELCQLLRAGNIIMKDRDVIFTSLWSFNEERKLDGEVTIEEIVYFAKEHMFSLYEKCIVTEEENAVKYWLERILLYSDLITYKNTVIACKGDIKEVSISPFSWEINLHWR